MRKRFQQVVSELIDQNDEFILLLGDIGVFGFRDSMAKHPTRVINLGILEQSMTSFAAGLALSGKVPILHSITPFLIERALEQIKIDFGYQKLGGKFISVGGSFDYSPLGATHHAPGDVSALLAIPGFDIYLPGSADELEHQLRSSIPTQSLAYFRLAEADLSDARVNPAGTSPQVLRVCSDTMVVAFGPSFAEARVVADELNLGLIYINELTNKSIMRLKDAIFASNPSKVVLVQPFYEGSISHLLGECLNNRRLLDIGVPRKFIHEYGTVSEIKSYLGLSSPQLISRISEFHNELV